MKKKIFLILFIVVLAIVAWPKEDIPAVDRHAKIPVDAIKMTPATDWSPPILHSNEFEKPVPFNAVNTAGAEDSPFFPSDADEFYFFFTPDVSVPIEQQLTDEVTGIWMSKLVDEAWQEATRVVLQKTGKLSLDGCEFVHGEMMLFCTAREGYTGLHWGTAKRSGDSWRGWKVDDFPEEYGVGELHMYEDELYYHSDVEGGKGGTDIWMLSKVDGEWVNPVNIEVVNTPDNDGFPYITPDGQEMWINRWYSGTPAVFRSKRVDGVWQKPELIVSQFAGEPTLDKEGNLYFVHHYYQNGVMLEADIYVAYRR
ncbi:hypothetical protein KKA95_04975 [Patescibacteria group bacterium]|nr:hypothetical protein [Patescibacteria group bacterium]